MNKTYIYKGKDNPEVGFLQGHVYTLIEQPLYKTLMMQFLDENGRVVLHGDLTQFQEYVLFDDKMRAIEMMLNRQEDYQAHKPTLHLVENHGDFQLVYWELGAVILYDGIVAFFQNDDDNWWYTGKAFSGKWLDSFTKAVTLINQEHV